MPALRIFGIPPPPSDAMEVDDGWTARTTPGQMRSVIERFLELHRAALPKDRPLARWLGVLDEGARARDTQTQFVTSVGDDDQRRAHDLIEAQRLGWSLSALYAPGRRLPDIDGMVGSESFNSPQPSHAVRAPARAFPHRSSREAARPERRS